MTVCGIIAEYDPFHKGHERHLRLAREKTGADYIVCVMSGSFTQRGQPALLPAHARAEMALKCGADIVLQSPYAFSVREAEYFALGGVYILHALGCVTHLSFGCEMDDLSLLQKAAACLERQEAAFTAALQAGLGGGLSFAAAQGAALKGALGPAAEGLSAPNAALALCYLRSLLRLNSPIQPVPILRNADYHAAELKADAYPSASALRGAILRGDWPGVASAVPENALPALRRAVAEGLCPPDGLDSALRHTLLLARPKAIARWPGVDEGLEQRILRVLDHPMPVEEAVEAICTKRYPKARIRRILLRLLLELDREDPDVLKNPPYIRVLGFRKGSEELLSELTRMADVPVITNPSRQIDSLSASSQRLLRQEMLLTDLYFAHVPGSGKRRRAELTEPIIVI